MRCRRRRRRLAPLCKGSWRGEAVTEGLKNGKSSKTYAEQSLSLAALASSLYTREPNVACAAYTSSVICLRQMPASPQGEAFGARKSEKPNCFAIRPVPHAPCYAAPLHIDTNLSNFHIDTQHLVLIRPAQPQKNGQEPSSCPMQDTINIEAFINAPRTTPAASHTPAGG